MCIIKTSAIFTDDDGTIDLIGTYIRELEKTSWMRDAWNKDKSEHLKSTASA
jgi:starvation-inducible DNA-binding protein